MNILNTPRLLLRELEEWDLDALCAILSDRRVMYAYNRVFSRQEGKAWITRQQRRYADGIGLWAIVRRDTGEMIGQCGITIQQTGMARLPEIGYILRHDQWHMGYATEAALACREYAFERLSYNRVYSIISRENTPSRAVARRLGMTITGSLEIPWRGEPTLHLIYSVGKDELHP